MSNDSEDQQYEKALEEITSRFYEYENHRIVCILFKEYVEQNLARTKYREKKLRVWLEPEIIPKKGSKNQHNKTPDILVKIGNDWVILDYKEITSTDAKTLLSHIEDVSEYEQEFQFVSGSTNKKETNTFTPKVAIICPEGVASKFETLVTSVSIIGCKIGTKVVLWKIVDNFGKNSMLALFEKSLEIPQRDEKLPQLSEKLATIKFLRHDPQSLSYTALIVSDTIPTLDTKAYSTTIETSISELTDRLLGFYPAYLKNEHGFDIQQVTEGRVRKAVTFLDKIGYLDLKKEDKKTIILKRSKGKMIEDPLKYFIENEARLLVEERMKTEERKKKEELRKQQKKEKKIRKQALTKSGQTTLDDIF